MHETKDYNAIRSVAYFIPAMLLAMALRVGSSALLVHPREGLSGFTLFRSVTGFPLACKLIEYILCVTCFVFLYRLAETSKWIDIASTMLLCYMLTETLARTVEWLDYRLDPTGYTGAGVVMVAEIPVIFIILGIVFLIRGMSWIFAAMRNNEDEKKPLRRVHIFWVTGSCLLILAEILPEIFILYLKNDDAVFIRWLSLGLSVIFLASVIPFVLKLQHFTYEFYMYCYNRGR